MLLYIVRHAYAGQHGDPRYPDDALRPLTKKGRKQFSPRRQETGPPRLRAHAGRHQPAGALPANGRRDSPSGCAHRPKSIELDSLQPGSELETLVAWSNEQEVEELAWVGHSPDVDRMAAALIGGARGLDHFAKGAVAAIEFDERDRLRRRANCAGSSRPSARRVSGCVTLCASARRARCGCRAAQCQSLESRMIIDILRAGRGRIRGG